MKGVFDSAYARANPQKGRFAGAIDKYLMYHNYTIGGLLRRGSSTAGGDHTLYYYDNKHSGQSVSQSNVLVLDDDKTSTLTHCRFQARARYGIERVLVVDFDEFLFAQGGGTDPEQQRRYMDQYFDSRQHEMQQWSGGERDAAVGAVETGVRLGLGAPVEQGVGVEQLLFLQAIPRTRSQTMSRTARGVCCRCKPHAQPVLV